MKAKPKEFKEKLYTGMTAGTLQATIEGLSVRFRSLDCNHTFSIPFGAIDSMIVILAKASSHMKETKLDIKVRDV
jgi:hypothetical protein